MTVQRIGKSVLKIKLTDNEVISYFGAYERLKSMSSNIQYAINTLLRDIIEENREFFENKNISGGIKAVKNRGCEIILYHGKPSRKTDEAEYCFLFSDSESLTEAVLLLYGEKRTKKLKSQLYRLYEDYCLIIKTGTPEELYIMNEVICKKPASPHFAEYAKEHGDPLIINNAINSYGVIFSKHNDFLK